MDSFPSMSGDGGCALVIRPPDLPTDLNIPAIFLAGPTTSRSPPDWRTRLCTSDADLSVAILDPMNLAWDSTWKEDHSDPRWVAQVDWEMSMREAADVATKANNFGLGSEGLFEEGQRSVCLRPLRSECGRRRGHADGWLEINTAGDAQGHDVKAICVSAIAYV
ncbi:hypothetical protein CC79DRAFT_1335130 [Sarocladium strictum]